jgi:hypothetical protein
VSFGAPERRGSAEEHGGFTAEGKAGMGHLEGQQGRRPWSLNQIEVTLEKR